MKKLLPTLFFLLCSFVSYGLVYTVNVPSGTVECYIAGEQTGWSQVQMEKIAENKFQIDLPNATTAHKYKYCAGPSWQYVEKNTSGGDVADRSYSTNDQVAGWALIYNPELKEGDITITVTIPDDTPLENNIYIAGSFQGYKPTAAVQMKKLSDYIYTTTVKSVTQINYKILCGKSWNNVEVEIDGDDISDRIATSNNPSVNIKVVKWKSTDVELLPYAYLDEDFDLSRYLSGTRNVWIYLPKDYAKNTNKRYPVLYMHDGQNVFEQGSYGTWEAHKAFDKIQNEGKDVGIVVAINNGAGRMSEYAPFPNIPNAPVAQGDEYLQAIIKVIMPYINANYRTLTGAKNTGIAGSSLGGLISYYAGLKYPDIFGKIGAMSPSFWYCKSDLLDYVNNWETSINVEQARIYFICGDEESSSMVSDMQEFYEKTTMKGFSNKNLEYEVVKGGRHNEASWAAQIERVYNFMFNEIGLSSVEEDKMKENGVIVEVNGKDIKITNSKQQIPVDFKLFDISGKLIANKKIQDSDIIRNLTSGVYICKMQMDKKQEARKIFIH